MVAFIAWWFFAEHEKVSGHARQKSGYQEIEVEVMGGYSPETIVLKKNVPARIIFNRKDPNYARKSGRIWVFMWNEHDAWSHDCGIKE